MKKGQIVPSLLELCTRNVDENLDVMIGQWTRARLEHEAGQFNRPFVLNPFDQLRNN